MLVMAPALAEAQQAAPYQPPPPPQQKATQPPPAPAPPPQYPQQPPPQYQQPQRQPAYPAQQPPPAYQQPPPPPAYQPTPPPAYQQPPPPPQQVAPQPAAAPAAPEAAPADEAPAVALAAPKVYQPTPSDSLLPWNDHDPWGGAFKMQVTVAANQFVSGPVSGAGGEVGLRLGNDYIAVTGGSFQGKTGAWYAGIDLFRGSGNKVLYDALLPDVQVGLTFFGIETAYVGGDKIKVVRLKIPVVGLRITVEDFVTFDLRAPAVALWKSVDSGDDKAKPGISVGGTLDAGITF